MSDSRNTLLAALEKATEKYIAFNLNARSSFSILGQRHELPPIKHGDAGIKRAEAFLAECKLFETDTAIIVRMQAYIAENHNTFSNDGWEHSYSRYLQNLLLPGKYDALKPSPDVNQEEFNIVVLARTEEGHHIAAQAMAQTLKYHPLWQEGNVDKKPIHIEAVSVVPYAEEIEATVLEKVNQADQVYLFVDINRSLNLVTAGDGLFGQPMKTLLSHLPNVKFMLYGDTAHSDIYKLPALSERFFSSRDVIIATRKEKYAQVLHGQLVPAFCRTLTSDGIVTKESQVLAPILSQKEFLYFKSLRCPGQNSIYGDNRLRYPVPTYPETAETGVSVRLG